MAVCLSGQWEKKNGGRFRSGFNRSVTRLNAEKSSNDELDIWSLISVWSFPHLSLSFQIFPPDLPLLLPLLPLNLPFPLSLLALNLPLSPVGSNQILFFIEKKNMLSKLQSSHPHILSTYYSASINRLMSNIARMRWPIIGFFYKKYNRLIAFWVR